MGNYQIDSHFHMGREGRRDTGQGSEALEEIDIAIEFSGIEVDHTGSNPCDTGGTMFDITHGTAAFALAHNLQKTTLGPDTKTIEHVLFLLHTQFVEVLKISDYLIFKIWFVSPIERLEKVFLDGLTGGSGTVKIEGKHIIFIDASKGRACVMVAHRQIEIIVHNADQFVFGGGDPTINDQVLNLVIVKIAGGAAFLGEGQNQLQPPRVDAAKDAGLQVVNNAQFLRIFLAGAHYFQMPVFVEKAHHRVGHQDIAEVDHKRIAAQL